MHQFVNKIYIMAPGLLVLELKRLKLHGVVCIDDFMFSNFTHVHPVSTSINFTKSGMDIIGFSIIIHARSFYSQKEAETEYNEYGSLERYLKYQYLAQTYYTNGSEAQLCNQDVDYISNKLKIYDTMNSDIDTNATQLS